MNSRGEITESTLRGVVDVDDVEMLAEEAIRRLECEVHTRTSSLDRRRARLNQNTNGEIKGREIAPY
jgi:hypothetical protein